METYSPTQDLLTEFEVNLVQANHAKRFANYLIDLIISLFVLVIIVGLYMAITDFDTNNTDSFGFNLIVTLLLGLIWGIIEGLFKGKTLGKLITGTRAVNMDGTNISFKMAVLRGLSRIVPFEAFSALANTPPLPWHDRWTNTYVIDEKSSTRKPG